MFLTYPYMGQINHLQIKIQQKIARFLTCLGLISQVKGGLNNLIFSIGFQMLKI